MHDDAGEKRPECIKYCDVEDLEQQHASSHDIEQVKGESGSERTL